MALGCYIVRLKRVYGWMFLVLVQPVTKIIGVGTEMYTGIDDDLDLGFSVLFLKLKKEMFQGDGFS